MDANVPLKKVIWVGPSRRELRSFPDPVQDHVGYALYVAQRGGKHRDAKTLSGFGGAGVVEVVSDYRGDTFPRRIYRAIRREFVRTPRLSEEVEERTGYAAARHGFDSSTVARSRSDRQGD